MLGDQVIDVIHVPMHFDSISAYQPQLERLLAEVPLTADAWQQEQILIVLPSQNYIAALLVAELHGRMGYFAPVVRLRAAENVLPPRFEVAEILDLQSVRECARKTR